MGRFTLDALCTGLAKRDKDENHPVETPAELKPSSTCPTGSIKNDPVWVPPLRDEQRGQFDQVRNPLLDHCEYALFLLLGRRGSHRAHLRRLSTSWQLKPGESRSGCSATMNARPTRSLRVFCWILPVDWLRPARHESHARSMELCLSGVGGSGGGLFAFTGGHGTLQPCLTITTSSRLMDWQR